jgi:hypothetical protein
LKELRPEGRTKAARTDPAPAAGLREDEFDLTSDALSLLHGSC